MLTGMQENACNIVCRTICLRWGFSAPPRTPNKCHMHTNVFFTHFVSSAIFPIIHFCESCHVNPINEHITDISSGGSKGGGVRGILTPPPPPLSGKYNVLVNYIRICLARYTM